MAGSLIFIHPPGDEARVMRASSWTAWTSASTSACASPSWACAVPAECKASGAAHHQSHCARRYYQTSCLNLCPLPCVVSTFATPMALNLDLYSGQENTMNNPQHPSNPGKPPHSPGPPGDHPPGPPGGRPPGPPGGPPPGPPIPPKPPHRHVG